MSAELGIGARVRTGWTPRLESEGIALSTGTIVEGPYLPGVLYEIEERAGKVTRFMPAEPGWGVHIDHDTHTLHVLPDRLLFPIDGGDPVTTTETKEVEA